MCEYSERLRNKDEKNKQIKIEKQTNINESDNDVSF